MSLQQIKSKLAAEKERLAKKYNVSTMAIFGSYARGEETPKSDVDVLVDFSDRIGIEFIDLAYELEDLLKMKVDLVSRGGVKDRYFKEIKDDLIYV